jgi:exo-beta-1,3-glucanase (GH17 family)
MKHAVLFLLLMAVVTGCKKKTADLLTRSFYMGVTPWPGDFTVAEANKAYNFINNNCDLVSQHVDEGIPYEEAYTNTGWPAGLIADIDTRKTKTAAGKKILLSSSALSLTRKAKSLYSKYSETVSTTIKNQWEALPFNDPKVITAYTNFIIYLASQLHQSYINYGVESNEATWNVNDFAQYKDFLSQVYTKLKTAFPQIPVMVSFMVTEQPEALTHAAELVAYTDYIALSAYPYTHVSSSASGNTDPALFPADFFTRFINLDTAKPFCFAETGYIAEPLVVPSFNLNKQGNAQWQNDYLQKTMELTNLRKGKFIIWFCNKDYDAGNNTLRSLGLYQDLLALWEDTGLTDENDLHRPAYNTWQSWMQRTKVE